MELNVNDTNHDLNSQEIEKFYACDQCDGRFTRLYNLKMHKKAIHDGIRPHLCKVCGKTFSNSTKLKYHSTLHTGKPYSCEICEKSFIVKSFTRSSDLEKHKKLVHIRIRSFICSECGKGFTTSAILKDHLSTHSGQKRFACDMCDKSYNRLSYLSAHKKIVHKGFPSHFCRVCAERFTSAAELTEHIISEHKIADQNPHVCDQCDKIFLFPASLLNHKRAVHQGLRSHICSICDRTFITSTNLKYHLSSAHTGEKSQACDVCGASFIRPCDLQRHKQQHHQGFRPHGCELCVKRFVTATHLKQHIRSAHSEDTAKKSYACDQCSKSFANPSNLSAHKKIVHRGIRQYLCSVCDKRFGTSMELTEHLTTHTGQKPHSCSQCDALFTKSSSLSHHKKMVHRGANLYACHRCNKSFVLKANLERHSCSNSTNKSISDELNSNVD